MNDDFGVCLGVKPMAQRFKMQTLFLEIIYFAVEDEPDGPVFVRHRLAPCRRDVENGKSIVSNSHALGNPGRGKAAEIETIWAAMADGLSHPLDRALELDTVEAFSCDSGDSAHMLRSSRAVAGPQADPSREPLLFLPRERRVWANRCECCRRIPGSGARACSRVFRLRSPNRY